MTKHQSFWPRALTWLIGVAYVLALGASVSAAFYVWDRMAGELMPIVCYGGVLIIALFGAAWSLYVFYDRIGTVFFRVGGFCFLFVLGSLLYFLVPVDQGVLASGARNDAIVSNEVVSAQSGGYHGLNATTNRAALVQRGFEAINRAAASFFRSQGGLESPEGSTKVYCCYAVFQMLVVLYLVGLAFSYLGRDFFNSVHVVLSKRNRTLAIWGYSHKAELLVRGLTPESNVRNVIFLLSLSDEYDDNRRKRLVHKISRLKSDHCRVQCHWHFVDYDAVSPGNIVADRNFFISESGRFNIALAQKAIEAANEKRLDSMVYYVRVETSSDEKYFSTWIDGLSDGKTNGGIPVDIRILKESDMIAESLVTQSPVEMRMPLNVGPGVKSEKPFSVLFVGFGKNGRSAMNKTIENSQCSWRDFRATVVDKDLKSWQAFERKCGEAVREYHISFEQHEFGTCAFSEFLERALNNCAYDRIIVCLGDDKQALSFCSEAERIQREKFPRVRETPIYVQMDEPYAAFEKGVNGEPGDNRECVGGANLRCLAMASNITIFGTLNHIYNMYCIDDEAVLRTAKWLQYWYNGGDDGCGHKKKLEMARDCGQFTKMRTQIMDEEWKSTRYFDKCSTRSAAFGQRNLLRMLGFEIRQFDVKKSEDRIVSREEFEACISGGALCLLAECEHLRWNAFHFVRGIRKWDMQSPSLDEVYGSLLAEAGLERSCQQEVLEGRAYLKVLKEIKHNQIKRMNAHAALVPFRDLPRTDADFDNFLCGIMHQGLPNAVPADFQGEKQKRHCAVVDEVAYGFGLNCDAMQENDFKFSRTLYDNVMNSGCVLVWQKQKKEGEK